MVASFDTIPKDRLLARVGQKVSDGRLLALVEAFLDQGVLDGLEEWTPEHGTPQGAVCSPLLSNIYLDPLDHLMKARGFAMVRYADDFVVLCRSPHDAAAALAAVQEWTAAAGLLLHPTKTRLVNAQESGFDFLGYHFAAGGRRPRQKSLMKLKDAVRAKTKRTAGHSLGLIIADLNRTLRGWFEYFQAQPPYDVSAARRLDPPAPAQHPAPADASEGNQSRLRPHQVAKCLLCRTRALQLARCPCLGPPVLLQVKPSTGEPDAGDPHVRLCVQRRLACSAGDKPAGVKVRAP